MGFYRKILVLLDCSPVDDVIIDHVKGLAKAEEASVVLLHVVHSHTLDQDRALGERARSCGARRAAEFEALSIPVETLLLSGEPEVEIVKHVRHGDYDLLALATHGHKVFSDILYGSVSDHLKHELDIPLLLIKGAPGSSEGA